MVFVGDSGGGLPLWKPHLTLFGHGVGVLDGHLPALETFHQHMQVSERGALDATGREAADPFVDGHLRMHAGKPTDLVGSGLPQLLLSPRREGQVAFL